MEILKFQKTKNNIKYKFILKKSNIDNQYYIIYKKYINNEIILKEKKIIDEYNYLSNFFDYIFYKYTNMEFNNDDMEIDND
jgi:hypothetical protein